MNVPHPIALKPRKAPVQARSAAKVEGITEATIQVLLAEGPRRLTTTRAAQRAGVSVGTMYQYFPHKEALLYDVLRRHLEAVAQAVEAASARYRGQPLATMTDGLVNRYIDAKTARADASRALYLVASELDTTALMGRLRERIRTATIALLGSAADAEFDDIETAAFTLLAAMTGTLRTMFEQDTTPAHVHALRTQLTLMCQAYLEKATRPMR
jgi:AcrR family transcriptional regulator